MNLFKLNTIITKFNKLKAELNSYLTAQEQVIDNLEERLKTEKADYNTAERLVKLLQGDDK